MPRAIRIRLLTRKYNTRNGQKIEVQLICNPAQRIEEREVVWNDRKNI